MVVNFSAKICVQVVYVLLLRAMPTFLCIHSVVHYNGVSLVLASAFSLQSPTSMSPDLMVKMDCQDINQGASNNNILAFDPPPLLGCHMLSPKLSSFDAPLVRLVITSMKNIINHQRICGLIVAEIIRWKFNLIILCIPNIILQFNR